MGQTLVMPRQYATMEAAPDPRPQMREAFATMLSTTRKYSQKFFCRIMESSYSMRRRTGPGGFSPYLRLAPRRVFSYRSRSAGRLVFSFKGGMTVPKFGPVKQSFSARAWVF